MLLIQTKALRVLTKVHQQTMWVLTTGVNGNQRFMVRILIN